MDKWIRAIDCNTDIPNSIILFLIHFFGACPSYLSLWDDESKLIRPHVDGRSFGDDLNICTIINWNL